MVKSKSELKREAIQSESSDAPVAKYRYVCPACTNTAIETSNQMLGVGVDCQSCGTHIMLSIPGNYIKLE